jgi:hypothetical protein
VEQERQPRDDAYAHRDVSLKEYVELAFAERQRATELSEREREKAAQALSTSLERSIREGDERLREHIANQVDQIQAALDSARRETQFANDASQKAIEKAETSTDKRFAAVNEFREQIADQAARFVPREVADAENKDALRRIEANAESIATLRNTTLTRERFETTTADWTTWREITDRRLSEQAGAARGITSSVGFIVAIAGVLLTVVIIVIGVLA